LFSILVRNNEWFFKWGKKMNCISGYLKRFLLIILLPSVLSVYSVKKDIESQLRRETSCLWKRALDRCCSTVTSKLCAAKKNCEAKWKNLSMSKKNVIGYLGLAALVGLNDRYRNFAFGRPFAFFIGQCAGVIAHRSSYSRKFWGGVAASLVFSILYESIHFDSSGALSATGFILWSSISDFMKVRKNF